MPTSSREYLNPITAIALLLVSLIALIGVTTPATAGGPTDQNTYMPKVRAEQAVQVCLTGAGRVRDIVGDDIAMKYEDLAREFGVLAGTDNPSEEQLESLSINLRKLEAKFGWSYCSLKAFRVFARDRSCEDLPKKLESLADKFGVLAESDNPSAEQLELLSTNRRKLEAEWGQKYTLDKARQVFYSEDLAKKFESLAAEFGALADSDNPTDLQLSDLCTKQEKLDDERLMVRDHNRSVTSSVCTSRQLVYGGAAAVGALAWAVWNGWFGS